MIHIPLIKTLYVEDYDTADIISTILNTYYDGVIESITLCNETEFEVMGHEMTVETEHNKWVIKKK